MSERTGMLRLAFGGLGQLWGVLRAHRGRFRFCLLLLAVDLFWIGYFMLGKGAYELGRGDALYNHKELLITTDGGVPEWFGYLQMVLAIVLLVRVTRGTRQPIYAALAWVFLVVLLDDAMEIHETLGKNIARSADLPGLWGIRPRDFGEVITWVLLGLWTVPPFLIAQARSTMPHRGWGLAFLVPFATLLFCAMVVDQLYHVYSDLFAVAGVLLDSLEDGGELVSITAIAALALAVERACRSES